MTGETLGPVAAALLCVLAVGAAGASLETSVAGNPGDGLALAYDGLPVSQERADAVVEGATAVAEEAGVVVERITVTAEAEGVVDELDSVAEELALDEDVEPVGRPPADVGEYRDVEVASDSPDQPDDADSESWFDRLAALLGELRALAAAVGLVAVALTYRRADDLRALVGDVRWAAPTESDSGADGAGEAWPADPSGEVARAWAEMVSRLDVERPRSKTAAECAAAAIEAGMDPEAVRTITRAFEAVRYGDGEATDERVRRVRQALRALDRDPGGESP